MKLNIKRKDLAVLIGVAGTGLAALGVEQAQQLFCTYHEDHPTCLAISPELRHVDQEGPAAPLMAVRMPVVQHSAQPHVPGSPLYTSSGNAPRPSPEKFELT